MFSLTEVCRVQGLLLRFYSKYSKLKLGLRLPLIEKDMFTASYNLMF